MSVCMMMWFAGRSTWATGVALSFTSPDLTKLFWCNRNQGLFASRDRGGGDLRIDIEVAWCTMCWKMRAGVSLTQ